MSFFDDASLVFLPSGQAGKDGKAYSMKPTNGDGDFTFSRGSNLTATRVDSNGLIEKGRENLLLQSNQFDTTWTTSSASVTSGQGGYDGSTDAWLLEATGTSSTRVQQTVSTDSVQTISVYAKKGTSDYFQIRLTGASTAFAFFDLANGTLGTLSNQVDASITSVGSGDWYRCSLTRVGAATSARIYVTGNNTTSVTSGDNIYIQDAQLEQGLVATEYIESGASTGLAGILEDSPRFDYSGGASCPSLLLEPQRTNLVTQTEYFNTTDHILNPNISVTNNATTSPEGLQNAAEITFDSSVNRGLASLTFGDYSNQTHSVSIWAKSSGGVENVRLKITAGGVADYFSSNFQLTDEWQRLEFSQAFGATTTSNIQGGIVNGTGETAGTAYIYGLQLEANASYPTSYIPNHSGGSVTREAEVCEGAGDASTFNDSEGVLYLEASAIDNGSSEKAIAINDGTTNNRINIRIVNNTIKGLVILGGSLVCNISYTATSVITSNKIAFKYKRNDFALWLNGVEVGTDTSGSIFPADTLNELSFDYGGASAFFYGNVEQVLYFPTALSDVELTALTS